MKKIILGSVLAFVLLVSMSVGAIAQTAQLGAPLIGIPLAFRSPNFSEVVKLQNFLINQGFLKNSVADGKFGPLTRNAVTAFQASQGLKADGIFGPITLAATNKMISGLASSVPSNSATVGVQSVSNFNSTLSAAALPQDNKVVTWQTFNYPANVGVNINLLRKIANSPATYTLVRVISKNTGNDGTENWTLRTEENTGNLYVEVTCSNLFPSNQNCQFVGKPIPVN